MVGTDLAYGALPTELCFPLYSGKMMSAYSKGAHSSVSAAICPKKLCTLSWRCPCVWYARYTPPVVVLDLITHPKASPQLRSARPHFANGDYNFGPAAAASPHRQHHTLCQCRASGADTRSHAKIPFFVSSLFPVSRSARSAG
eukprot:411670-Rhodomonas_salina.1